MNLRRPRIGIETRLMSGHTTGIGNYTLHLLSALAASYPDLDYRGFGRASWFPVDAQMLQQISSSKQNDEPGKRAASGLLGSLRQRASRVEAVQKAYWRAHCLAFAGTVRGQRLDLFHALNFMAPAAPGVPILPVVYDLSHVRYPGTHPAERLRRMEPLADMLRTCAVIQTISEFSRAEIASHYGIASDRIFVAPPAASSIYKPLGQSASTPHLTALDLSFGSYLLAVGTLEPRKNLRTLINAYSQLASAERLRAPLAIVGGVGWGNIDLPREAEALKQEGTLRFLGALPDPVLRSLYEGAIALLFPSLYEGFGMPAVEAMSCGTEVVHSVNTSVDEITNGLCRSVDALDVDAWASEMKTLSARGYQADPARRQALIERAGTFDWTLSARRVRKAYDALIA